MTIQVQQSDVVGQMPLCDLPMVLDYSCCRDKLTHKPAIKAGKGEVIIATIPMLPIWHRLGGIGSFNKDLKAYVRTYIH